MKMEMHKLKHSLSQRKYEQLALKLAQYKQAIELGEEKVVKAHEHWCNRINLLYQEVEKWLQPITQRELIQIVKLPHPLQEKQGLEKLTVLKVTFFEGSEIVFKPKYVLEKIIRQVEINFRGESTIIYLNRLLA